MLHIPDEIKKIIDLDSDYICHNTWEQIKNLICPSPEQHMLLYTNAPNNTLLLANKIYKLFGLDLNKFRVFKVGNDLYDHERNHGIYTFDNNYFYMDMKRIRYDDYKYMICILENIIYSKRIDFIETNKQEPSKITILINNFDVILPQYLHKFVKYANTLSSITFIYIGTNNINFYAVSTKLKGLCIIKKCYFNKLPLHVFDIIPSHLIESTNKINNMLFFFTNGDIIKSWFIIHAFINSNSNNTTTKPNVSATKPNVSATEIDLFHTYILPHMPILNSIYDLLCSINTTVTQKTYNITHIMNKLYILHSYPDCDIPRIITYILNIFTFIHKYAPNHKLYLSSSKMLELTKLCNTYTEMDKFIPYKINEPVLILRGFVCKLMLFL